MDLPSYRSARDLFDSHRCKALRPGPAPRTAV